MTGRRVKNINVIVTSANPVKLEATANGFAAMFPNLKVNYEILKVPSGVPDQPLSDEETLTGARNRVRAAREQKQADYYVGLEGGVGDIDGKMMVFGWIYVENDAGVIGQARTSSFLLPIKVSEMIRHGLELGEADDKFFGQTNSKQANGSVGLLTDDLITRSKYYTEAVILALIPFKKAQYEF